jgi:predicted enzyme related to lactoylglutathione lyase
VAHGAIEWMDLPAPDPIEAARFYEAVFGWKIQRDPTFPDYPMFMDTSDRVGGGFMRSGKPAAEGGVMFYITVDDVDDALSEVKAHGGSVIKGRTEISPTVGWFGIFRDPAGNAMGLYQKLVQG